MIELLTIPNCPRCKKLEMMLSREGIEYEHILIDIDTADGLALAQYYGVRYDTFPVAVIDGQTVRGTVEGLFSILKAEAEQ